MSTLVTHDGTFHCDEALAVFMLRQLPRFQQHKLIRTRDENLISQADIVVDVGSVFDIDRQRFDHHQRGFEHVFDESHQTKLSSAGLVYKYYGKEIITAILQSSTSKVSQEQVQILWLKLYDNYLEAIDAVDNGISAYPKELQPAYRNRSDISSRVGWLNPAWNETVGVDEIDQRFAKASELVGHEFIDRLRYLHNAWLPARQIIQDALQSRLHLDASGQIMLLSSFAPWKEHLYDLELELTVPDAQKPLVVLFPDQSGSWRVAAVPVSSGSFESRRALPVAWRGLRDQVLSTEAQIPDCIFVHASGFIGGNKTKEGALAMARVAIK